MDGYLEPWKGEIKRRFDLTHGWIKTLDETEGGLEKFSRGYEIFGFHVLPNNDIVYREWAPAALRAYLIGDFSQSMAETT